MSIILLLHLFMLTFTFGHVELLTVDYHSIDTPIVELNNHTLREVFEDGNDFKDSFVTVAGTFTISEIDDYYRMTRTSSDGTVIRIGILTNVSNNDVYWLKINYKKNVTGNSNAITLRNTPDVYAQDVINTPASVDEQFVNLKIITTSIANILSLGFGISNGEYVDIGKSIYWINLSNFGIDNLTVEQMDIYYELYQENMLADDVTYVKNEMTITDLTYILGFAFVWFVIIWVIRKVVL